MTSSTQLIDCSIIDLDSGPSNIIEVVPSCSKPTSTSNTTNYCQLVPTSEGGYVVKLTSQPSEVPMKNVSNIHLKSPVLGNQTRPVSVMPCDQSQSVASVLSAESLASAATGQYLGFPSHNLSLQMDRPKTRASSYLGWLGRKHPVTVSPDFGGILQLNLVDDVPSTLSPAVSRLKSTLLLRQTNPTPAKQAPSQLYRVIDTTTHSLDFTCVICQRILKDASSLLIHVQLSHPHTPIPVVTDAGFSCKKCSFPAKSWHLLNLHEIRAHAALPLAQKMSVRTLLSATDPYKVPKSPKPEGSAYECVLCSFTTKDKEAFQVHLKNEHKVDTPLPQFDNQGQFQCLSCSFKTNEWLALLKHQQSECAVFRGTSDDLQSFSTGKSIASEPENQDGGIEELAEVIKPPLTDPKTGDTIYCQPDLQIPGGFVYECPHCKLVRMNTKGGMYNHIKIFHMQDKSGTIGLATPNSSPLLVLSDTSQESGSVNTSSSKSLGLNVRDPKSGTVIEPTLDGDSQEKLIYSCPYCNFFTKNKHSLHSHIKVIHMQKEGSSRPPPIRDPYTKKMIHSKPFRDNPGDCVYQCPHCEVFMTRNRRSLVKHIRHGHVNQGQSPKKGSTLVSAANMPRTPMKDPKTGKLVYGTVIGDNPLDIMFRCPECPLLTPYKRSLYQHIKTKHMKPGDPVMSTTYDTPSSSLNITADSALPLMDPKSGIDIPPRLVAGELFYDCPYCAVYSKKKSVLLAHISGTHLKLKKCNGFRCFVANCTNTLPTMADFESHMQSEHPDRKCPHLTENGFACQHCSFESSSYTSVQCHKKKVHLENLKNEIRKKLVKKGALMSDHSIPSVDEDSRDPDLPIPKKKARRSSVSPEEKLPCLHCATVLNSEPEFQSHMTEKHPTVATAPEGEKRFSCKEPLCSFTTRGYMVYLIHQSRKHAQQAPKKDDKSEEGQAIKSPNKQVFQCALCGYSSLDSNAYESHFNQQRHLEMREKRVQAVEDEAIAGAEENDAVVATAEEDGASQLHLEPENAINDADRVELPDDDFEMDYEEHKSGDEQAEHNDLAVVKDALKLPASSEPILERLEREAESLSKHSDLFRVTKLANGDARFDCPWCDFGHTNQLCFMSHLSKTHKELPYEDVAAKVVKHKYECQLCGLETSNQLYFFKHRKAHDMNKI